MKNKKKKLTEVQKLKKKIKLLNHQVRANESEIRYKDSLLDTEQELRKKDNANLTDKIKYLDNSKDFIAREKDQYYRDLNNAKGKLLRYESIIRGLRESHQKLLLSLEIL